MNAPRENRAIQLLSAIEDVANWEGWASLDDIAECLDGLPGWVGIDFSEIAYRLILMIGAGLVENPAGLSAGSTYGLSMKGERTLREYNDRKGD